MAFIGLRVPHETARLLGSIEVPGNKVPLDHMHVTVLYLGEDVPIQQIAKAVIATYRVTSCRTPFNLKTSRVKCFPGGDTGTPVIAKVLSPELHEFHENLCDAFDKAGVTYSKKFPEYRPHVSLSYADECIKDVCLPESLTWAAHEATLWGGDWGDDRLSVTFPFTLKPSKEGFYRSVIKTAKKFSSSK